MSKEALLQELNGNLKAMAEVLNVFASELGLGPIGEPVPIEIEGQPERVLGVSQYGGVKLARVEALKKRLKESSDPIEKRFAEVIGEYHFVFDQPGYNDFQKLHVSANIGDLTMLSGMLATSAENRAFGGPANLYTEVANYWGRGKRPVKGNAIPDHMTWVEGLDPALATNTNTVYPRLVRALERLKTDGFAQILTFQTPVDSRR